MSSWLCAERDRLQKQVEQLEQSLSVSDAELELLSSETDDGSDEDHLEDESVGLKERREKIQREIQDLEDALGQPGVDDSSSDESDLGLSPSVDSCLQMNLVYQQVLQETLDQLEMLLTHNATQQKELMSQLSGPIREAPRDQTAPSSYQQPINMYLGHFLKPYFKDKLTGLGPPANQEARERSSRMTGVLDSNRLKVKRWESWQKTLLFHSVSKDQLKRLIQPKLSRVELLSHKLSSAMETDRQQLQEQIDGLEREMDLLRGKKEEELIGERHDEHDWEKISNIDFEGTRDAADIRCFWQNFLHPSINKSPWSHEEVQLLKEVSRRQQEQHWKEVAQELGTGRTAFMCLQTFQRFLSESLRRHAWTPDEDDVLRHLVKQMRIGNFIPYTQMSYFMEGRQPSQLVYRWNQVLDPAIRRGPWSEEEDELLLQGVARHGERNWWKIRLEVPGRTYNGCRDRYMDCLKAGTKRGPFDQHEIDLLLKLVEKHGVGHWSKIAAEIPQRLDSQCLRVWRALKNNPQVRKLRKAKPKPAQEKKEKKMGGPARKKLRRRPVTVKEEDFSEEEMVVEYMDSDDDDKQKVNVVMQTEEEEEQEEEEEEYSIPPIQDWIPASGGQSVGLEFSPAVFPVDAPPSGHRCTILMKSGVLAVTGQPPRQLPGTTPCCGALVKVRAKDLQAYLTGLAHPTSGKDGPRRSACPRTQVDYELMAAVTPWIGDLLMETTATVADSIRERVEARRLSSSAVFQLLLQGLRVDAKGCKETIEQRSSRAAPSSLDAASKRREAGKGDGLPARGGPRDTRQRLMLKEAQPPRPAQKLLLLRCTSPTPSQPLQGPLWATQITMCHPPPPAPPPAPRSQLPAPTPGLQHVWMANEQQPPGEGVQEEVPRVFCGTHKEADVVRNHVTSTPKPAALPLPQHPTHPAPRDPQPGPATTLSPASLSRLSILLDHQYVSKNGAPEARHRGRKRQREEVQQGTQEVNEGMAGPAQEGKRIRKPSLKAQALLVTTRAKMAAKKKKRVSRSNQVDGSRSRGMLPRSRTSRVEGPESGSNWVRGPPLPGLQSNSSQSMWVMTPTGLVQLTTTPNQKRPVVLLPGPSGPLPPGCVARPAAPPVLPLSVPMNQPRPSGSSPLSDLPPQRPSRVFPPYRAADTADPAAPQPHRTNDHQTDGSLMFPEPVEAGDWLSGRGGVAVAESGSTLPYLPPFLSSLRVLRVLLKARGSLRRASLQLLDSGPLNLQLGPQNLPAGPGPSSTVDPPSQTPPGLPDSTWDLGSVQPGLCNGLKEEHQQDEEGEEQLVAAVRHLVLERFSSNPAYQLLKARFLSCFTVPALLATVQPITHEEEEEEEELSITEGPQRDKGSGLLCDITGAPANHVSGMEDSTPDKTGSSRPRGTRSPPSDL